MFQLLALRALLIELLLPLINLIDERLQLNLHRLLHVSFGCFRIVVPVIA